MPEFRLAGCGVTQPRRRQEEPFREIFVELLRLQFLRITLL